MPARGLRHHFVWPLGLDAVWLASAPLVFAAIALLSPIRPHDYFWALTQGRALLQIGRIPTENLFLYTLPETTPFFNQPWLAQLILYGAHQLGGHTANLLVLAVSVSVALLVLSDTALRLGAHARHVGIAALIALPFLAAGSGVRTQMFAYPCFAIVLCHAFSSEQTSSLRPALLVAVVTALWANLHGSFVLAPAVALFAMFCRFRAGPHPERRRAVVRGGLEAIAVILATFVNPWGPAIYAYVFRLGARVGIGAESDVAEWQPFALWSPLGFGFGLLVVGAAILAVRRPTREAVFGVVLSSVLAVLALKTQRLLAWWALSVIVPLPLLVASTTTRARPRVSPAAVALLLVLGGVTAASLPGGPVFEAAARQSHLPYSDARALGTETPWRTVDLLLHDGYPGNLFHHQALGGLVEWKLAADGPAPVAFVDQRFELTPPALWRDYFAISDATDGWTALLDRYEVGTLLLDEHQNAKLVAAVAKVPEWRLVRQEFSYRLYERPMKAVSDRKRGRQ